MFKEPLNLQQDFGYKRIYQNNFLGEVEIYNGDFLQVVTITNKKGEKVTLDKREVEQICQVFKELMNIKKGVKNGTVNQ